MTNRVFLYPHPNPYALLQVSFQTARILLSIQVSCDYRSYEDLDEAIDEGDVRSEGGRLPIGFEQAFSLQHRWC